MLNLICRVSGHKVNRHRVWHDGLDFRTRCLRCGAELLRAPAGWRVFDPVDDEHPQRDPHPRER